MGVTSLWELLNRCGKTFTIEELSNQRLAVDTSVWLVQFVRGMRADDGGPLENAHLRGIFSRVCKMLFFGIRPVFVFDGGKPEIKRATLALRAAARQKMEQKELATARELLMAQVRRRIKLLIRMLLDVSMRLARRTCLWETMTLFGWNAFFMSMESRTALFSFASKVFPVDFR